MVTIVTTVCQNRNPKNANIARVRAYGRAGFTLIELMVVMAIVALLLTIGLPRYFGSLDKAKDVALKENLQVMRVGIDKYFADKGRYPESLEDMVSKKYFYAVPLDPITESSTTWILIASTDADKPGIENIKSGAKGQSHEGVPYEQY